MRKPSVESQARSLRGDRRLALSFAWLPVLTLFAAMVYALLLVENVSIASAQPGPVPSSTATATPTHPPTPSEPPPRTDAPTATLTLTFTTTPPASVTAEAQPTDLSWPTIVPSATVAPTAAVTSTAPVSPTAVPIGGGAGILALEGLWGTQQACTEVLIDPENSIDLAFNDTTASCGPFGDGSTWAYTAIEDTGLAISAQAILEIRFYVSGWSNDPLLLEVNDGSGWQQVAALGGSSPPPTALETISYDVSAIFDVPAAVNAAQVRFSGGVRATPDNYTIHLDEARLSVSDVIPSPTPLPTLEPLPTPTLPPPASTQVPGADDPHVAYAATTTSCAACHRTHTATGTELRSSWPEEAACLICHSDAGPGTNVQPAFTDNTNTETAFFKHDVAATSGVHSVAETDPAHFGASNRHVECEDCHEPHEATRAAASAPALQPEMNWTSGVDPLWTASGAPADYSWLPHAEREYQVCFKCHSSFTSLPTYPPAGWDGTAYVADGLPKLTLSSPEQIPDSRDLAQEFNPYNASLHPVTAQGRNQAIPEGAFVSGWSSTSLVYCSDCHSGTNSDAPHGSALLHLLSGQADYQTAASSVPRQTGGELCFDCHDQADYTGNGADSNFRRANRNLHGQHADDATCYLCHDSHGSEQRHLLNLDTSVLNATNTYLLPGYDGLPVDSQTFWQISPDRSEKSCWLVCHGHDHSSSPYPNLVD